METAYLFAHLLFSLSVIGFLVVCILIMISLIRMPAPFVPTSGKIQGFIIDAMKLTPTSIMYDLGSGEGRVVAAGFKAQPQATYYGVELHQLPHLLAKARWLFMGRPKNVYFVQEDIFSTDISKASHIFMYLLPEVLESLLPKLQKDLKKGTRVVTCDFAFVKKSPLETREIPASLGRRLYCKKLYIYTF